MIKFVADRPDGGTVIGLGLSAENLKKLQEKKPIHIHLREMNLPWDGEIIIFFGDTEASMVAELRAGGIKLPDPIILPERQ